jgi:hypothetical protein
MCVGRWPSWFGADLSKKRLLERKIPNKSKENVCLTEGEAQGSWAGRLQTKRMKKGKIKA